MITSRELAPPRGRRPYTAGEEIANWLTHGLGMVASVVGFVILVMYARQRGDAWHVVSFTIFGVALLGLYGVSTAYHAVRGERAKRLFRKLDHAAIFLLIAGTYTPILLTTLRGPWGWSLFGVVWGLSCAGVVFELCFAGRYALVSILAYVFLGWLIVIAAQPMLTHLSRGALWLLLSGGLCYSSGVLFYRWHRLRYHHAVWHLFVLGGSACHYFAVLLLVRPR